LKLSVMIIGATGVFGSRLVEQLAVLGGVDLILAGRDATKADGMLADLRARGFSARFEVFDRNYPSTEKLKALAPRVIVDAAGPFQKSSLALAEAAIVAGVHYIDLADARDFVARIVSLDGAARKAGVAVISGASSTPALSHAVVDHLVQGWQRTHHILVAISPGNRAPRGLSVIAAILSYVGEPIALFRGCAQTTAYGWSLNESLDIAGVGRRPVALCETPDLDLLVTRYNPTVAAEFKAGLELGVMHHGLRLLGFLRVRGLLPNLAVFAKPMRFLAGLLYWFGSDRGGMVVRVVGRNASDTPCTATWSLAAEQGIGPIVPCLPALALIERFAACNPPEAGAYAASGHVRYDEMMSHFKRLGMKTHVSVELQ
jgi:hypothetical protein